MKLTTILSLTTDYIIAKCYYHTITIVQIQVLIIQTQYFMYWLQNFLKIQFYVFEKKNTDGPVNHESKNCF